MDSNKHTSNSLTQSQKKVKAKKTIKISEKSQMRGHQVFPNSLFNDENLDYFDYCLLLYLNAYCREKFPGHKKISIHTKISIPQIKRRLKKLKDLGYLSWERNGSDIGTNLYTLNLLNKDLPELTTESKEEKMEKNDQNIALPELTSAQKNEVTQTVAPVDPTRRIYQIHRDSSTRSLMYYKSIKKKCIKGGKENGLGLSVGQAEEKEEEKQVTLEDLYNLSRGIKPRNFLSSFKPSELPENKLKDLQADKPTERYSDGN